MHHLQNCVNNNLYDVIMHDVIMYDVIMYDVIMYDVIMCFIMIPLFLYVSSQSSWFAAGWSFSL